MYCPYCMNIIEQGENYCKVCGKNPSTYKSEAHHMPCGYVLNERYDIGSVLEEGEWGLVYIATDRKTGHKVFIKEYFPMNDAYRDLDLGMIVKCCIGSEEVFAKKKEKFIAIATSLIKNETIVEMLHDREYFTANQSVYLMTDFFGYTMFGQLIDENRFDEAIEGYKELWKSVEKQLFGNTPEKKKKVASTNVDHTIHSKKSLKERIQNMSWQAKVGLVMAEVISLVFVVLAILFVTHEHVYGEWMITKGATCTIAGERRRVCNCGEEQIEVIAATGHTIVVDEAVNVTCTTDGLTEGSHCSVCSEVLTSQEVVPKTGHTIVIDEAVEETCVKNGKTEGSHCSVCKEVLKEQKSVQALGHKVSDESCVRCGDGASEGLKFDLKEDDTYEVSKVGTCKDKEIIIPSIYNGKAVTSIGAQAFSDCTTMTKVIIPASVTLIEIGAFSGCSNLTTVKMSANVTSIEKEAFSQCTSLTSITIPSKVKSIGTFAFYGCDSLTKITIPASVTDLGSYAFAECEDLKTVTIRDGIKTIGIKTFYNCSSLTSVTIPSKLTKIRESAFENCGKLKKVIIPSSVTIIEKRAFANCNSLKVYAEAESKPSGWNNSWKTYRVKVEWGYEG